MALMRSYEVPKDAVVLDEHEATVYAWDFVNEWDTLSDTWALRYAPGILGAINAFSGILINKHYRDKLKLGSYGFMSSVIPITIMPGVLTPLFHRYLISTRMLLMKDDTCPICYEIRSAVIQLSLGVAYPMVLGPAAGLMFANRYSTYRVPELTKGPKVVLKFVSKLTRPFTGTLSVIAGFQLVASSVLTYFEMKNNMTLCKKVYEIEQKIAAEELAKE